MTVPPHPFVIQPPETLKREFAKGEELDCNLILFGSVNENIPYFIYAFEQSGIIGIGKKVNGRRSNFRLNKVYADSQIVFSGTDEWIALQNPSEFLNIRDEIHSSDLVFRIKVTLETPLRLKFQNRIKADLPFHVLIRAALRRTSSLFACYAGTEPDIDYKGLLERAAEIQTIDNQLDWYNWERYSNRQKQRMPLGGMIGSISYKGKLSEYLALLDVCSKLNLGKNTSFGLGKIGITVVG
jgi:hypothetical protein